MRNQTQLDRVQLLEENCVDSIRQNGFSNVEHDEIVQMFADIRRGYCEGLGSDYDGMPPIWVTMGPISSVTEPTCLWETNDNGVILVPPPTPIVVETRRYMDIQHFVGEVVRYFLDDRYENKEVFIYTVFKQFNPINPPFNTTEHFTYWVRWCKKTWGGNGLPKGLTKKVIKKHRFGTT